VQWGRKQDVENSTLQNYGEGVIIETKTMNGCKLLTRINAAEGIENRDRKDIKIRIREDIQIRMREDIETRIREDIEIRIREGIGIRIREGIGIRIRVNIETREGTCTGMC